MIEPHKILENLTYLNNCCRSITDKIRHSERQKMKYIAEGSFTSAANADVTIAELDKELIEAREKRTLARQEVNELFASLRG